MNGFFFCSIVTKKNLLSRYLKKKITFLDEKSSNVLPLAVCVLLSARFVYCLKNNDNIGEKFVILEILKTIFFFCPQSQCCQ